MNYATCLHSIVVILTAVTASAVGQDCHKQTIQPVLLYPNSQNAAIDCVYQPVETIQWLRDSIQMVTPSPGVTLLSGGTLELSTEASTGLYLCLAFSNNNVRLVSSFNVTRAPNYFTRVQALHESSTTSLQCGVPLNLIKPSKTLSRKKRIIDGTRALDGSAPWMGMITVERNSLICGCTLLNSNWVISAAHCLTSLEKNQLSQIRIKLGKHLRHQREESQFVTELDVIVLHPHFSSRAVYSGKIIVNSNDVALLKLKTPVPLDSANIRSICLPFSGFFKSLPKDILGVVTGWGRVSVQKSITAYTLQEAHLPFVDKVHCVASSDYALPEGTLCAGFAESYKPDTCDGDSGGPLSVVHGNRSFLVGIVSWGQGCSSPGKYGVYTQVEKYLDWIYSVIN